MIEENTEEAGDPDAGGGGIPLVVTVISLIGWAVAWSMQLRLLALMMQVVLISLIIWQACDPFAEAAQWIGKAMRLPGSVRGAVLDAVASSLPELFIAVFFVVAALVAPADALAGFGAELGRGYSSSVATCVGSAIYNMILIPAFCTVVISFTRPQRPTIDIDQQVISRDGMWYLGSQVVLIVFLMRGELHWWMGLVLIGLYVIYVAQLYRDAILHRRAYRAVDQHLRTSPEEATNEQIIAALRESGYRPTPAMVDEIRSDHALEEEELADQRAHDSAAILYGLLRVPLNFRNAWLLIGAATAVAGAACYWLVYVTNETAAALHVPVFFVAVILTAAASSVPDTFLSVGAALRGDDDGAVSNALGSNTFNICVGLAVPLLFSALLRGPQPFYLTQNGKPGGQPLEGIIDLQTLLCFLTIITLLMMWHNRQLTRIKAVFLLLFYFLFIGYAVAGSLGYDLQRLFTTGLARLLG